MAGLARRSPSDQHDADRTAEHDAPLHRHEHPHTAAGQQQCPAPNRSHESQAKREGVVERHQHRGGQTGQHQDGEDPRTELHVRGDHPHPQVQRRDQQRGGKRVPEPDRDGHRAQDQQQARRRPRAR